MAHFSIGEAANIGAFRLSLAVSTVAEELVSQRNGTDCGVIIPNPIFMGGMFKSGTSLVRAMLGRHSRLFAGLETQWLNERWHEDAVGSRRAWLLRMSVFFDTPLAELEAACGDSREVETALDRMMNLLASRAGKIRWIEKTPGNAGAIPRILSSWSRPQFLHIVRDPRDVYASMLETGKWCEPVVFANKWCSTFGAARDWLVAVGGSHTAYCEMRYEKLVLKPEEALRKIFEFLEEPWEPNLAYFEGVSEDFERVLRATGKASPTLKRLATPLTSKRVGVWRSIVDPERWHRVRAELERRGYASDVDRLVAETDESFVLPED